MDITKAGTVLADRIRKIGVREVARRTKMPLSSVSEIANHPKRIRVVDLDTLGTAVGVAFFMKNRTSVLDEVKRRTPTKAGATPPRKERKSRKIGTHMKLSAN